jgi:hypothetical protein
VVSGKWVFFCVVFGGFSDTSIVLVFELPMQRSAQKRNKNYRKNGMEFFSFPCKITYNV